VRVFAAPSEDVPTSAPLEIAVNCSGTVATISLVVRLLG
jgi:hypothetical protein